MGDRSKIQRWQGLLVGLLGGWGEIGLSMLAAVAQNVPNNIIPDTTLGAENSQLPPSLQSPELSIITGGAQRGKNLFHSFREFNISRGQEAYFFSRNASIQNILARVTGSNPSNIEGRLGTFLVIGGEAVPSNANLFLINPNGIIFDSRSTLDVGGSFVATTANAIQFGNVDFFSATEPSVPSNMLTIDPSALFYTALSAQSMGIVNRSAITVSDNFIGTTKGLQVRDGHSLLLVGGDVRLEGGILRALGGNVELAGIAAPTTVGLKISGNTLKLAVPADVQRADVVLTDPSGNASGIYVAGSSGGNITLYARNLDILANGFLIAGIEGSGSLNNQAGDITVDASGAVKIVNSAIGNSVLPDAVGKAGNITIRANILTVTNGGSIFAGTLGQGDAGNVTLIVHDATTFDGVNSDGVPSNASGEVNTNAKGNGGNLSLTTGSLTVTNGAQLGSSTFGQGNAGNVTLIVRDATIFDGVGSTGSSSQAGSQVIANAKGNGGNLTLTTRSLTVTNGAGFSSATFGQGDAGDVTLIVHEAAIFDGVGSNGASSTVSK